MREILLFDRKLVALVSDEDYGRVSLHKWYAVYHAGTWYAVTTFGEKRSPVYMHRFILGLNSNDSRQIDHINRNGLDNRRENLRFANHSQQQGNAGKKQGLYSSKYKGVSWSKARQKWIATIQENGRSRYLGGYDEELDAKEAYDNAAKNYYGEYYEP